jgi:hypothetical protein
VYVTENELLGKPKNGKVGRNSVSLFKKDLLGHLPKAICEYFTSSGIESWHENYQKSFRDALAHRIPLYVPPGVMNDDEVKRFRQIEDEKATVDFSSAEGLDKYQSLLDEQKALGKVSMFFAGGVEDAQPAFIHAQLICDFLTIEEMIEMFVDHIGDAL